MCPRREERTYKFCQLLHILSGGLEGEDFLALAWISVGQERSRVLLMLMASPNGYLIR